MELIRNKVSESGILTLDAGNFSPEGSRSSIDLKNQLWQELVLKEKDFRSFIKEHDWDQYSGHFVNVFCSADAIIPHWAFMLITSKLEGIAKLIFIGDSNQMEEHLILLAIDRLDEQDLENARIVIKGCGEKYVTPAVYSKLITKLQPLARSIMYGEPCSTVPVYKKKRS